MNINSKGEHPPGGAGTCVICKKRFCHYQDPEGAGQGTTVITLSRGDRLETGDRACMRFWTIVQGTAAVCTTFKDGRRQILGLDSAGDTTCGLMSSFESATWLEALEDCVICEQDFTAFADEFRDDPAFIRAIFEITHHRLEEASRHLATLGRLDSTERVILFLAEMVIRKKGRPVADTAVTLPMSREDIADYLGLNTETVSRILSRLKKSGIVRFLSPTEYLVPSFAAIERRLPVALPDRRNNPSSITHNPGQPVKERAG